MNNVIEIKKGNEANVYYTILNSNNIKLSEVEQHAKNNHFKEISLEVVNTNDIAIKLYKELGYNIIKEKHFGKITKSAGFTSNLYMMKEID